MAKFRPRTSSQNVTRDLQDYCNYPKGKLPEFCATGSCVFVSRALYLILTWSFDNQILISALLSLIEVALCSLLQ